MTEVTQSYHTHAKGEAQGWFASVTHPAHWLDKLDDTTSFRVQLGPFESLEEARYRAMYLTRLKLLPVHTRARWRTDEGTTTVTDPGPDSPA